MSMSEVELNSYTKKMPKVTCRVTLDNLILGGIKSERKERVKPIREPPDPKPPTPEPEPEPEAPLVQEEAVLAPTEDSPDSKLDIPKVKDVQLDVTDKINFKCSEADVVVKSEDVDVTGSILELEQDEVSTPKGPRRERLVPSPDIPKQNWIRPEVLLDEVWEKKRTLRLPTDEFDFSLPDDPKTIMSSNLWEVPELMQLKYQLNLTKSVLDTLPLHEWHNHTRRMNIAQLVMSYVKKYFNPEFSSQAWGKFFEILCTYEEVIPRRVLDELEALEDGKGTVPFDTVHLCEAPGAFISALNHFLKISYPNIDWNWLATTLNPYHEGNDISKMINDDRLIRMSLEHWTFLEDSTGNILSTSNLKRLVREKTDKLLKPREAVLANTQAGEGNADGSKEDGESSSKKIKLAENGDAAVESEVKPKSPKTSKPTRRPGVMLVTADGSIDCQSNPGEQERMVAHLQFGEIIAGLTLLQVGGSFVLKIFTFLEAPTICHLYLLSCVFREVHLFKPSTSKEGNSEVYVICLGYLGKTVLKHFWFAKFLGKIEVYGKLLDHGKVLFPLDSIPKFFLDRIKEAATFFCNYQMKIILRNYHSFGCDTRTYHVMKPFRMEAAEEWIQYTGIRPLPPKQRLFSTDPNDFKMNKASHMDLKIEHGSFADKIRRAQSNELIRIMYLKLDVASYGEWRGAHNQVIYGTFIKIGPVIFEKPYRNVRCSRFCLGSLLGLREELREMVKPYIDDLRRELEDQNSCKMHDKKSLQASIARQCEVELENLEVMCFFQKAWDFISKTDFQQQQQDLTSLFSAVQNIGEGRSIFLCRFPMLTRLQVGIIFCFASVFEKVVIYADSNEKVHGIMLHKFIGLIRPELKNMMSSLTDVLEVLNDADFNSPILQLVPMKALVDHMPTEFLVRYNMVLLTQDLSRSLGAIECSMFKVKMNPKMNAPVPEEGFACQAEVPIAGEADVNVQG